MKHHHNQATQVNSHLHKYSGSYSHLHIKGADIQTVLYYAFNLSTKL